MNIKTAPKAYSKNIGNWCGFFFAVDRCNVYPDELEITKQLIVNGN